MMRGINKIPINKIKTILLYFTNHEDVSSLFLGKVKLMKLFFFLDFSFVKRYGVPITGDQYFHLEYGPIPSKIKNLVDSASDDPDIAELSDVINVEKKHLSGGKEAFSVTSKRNMSDLDMEILSQAELEVLDYVCKKYGRMNTDQIWKESHDEPAYKETEEMELIPYNLAAKSLDCKFTAKEIDELIDIQC